MFLKNIFLKYGVLGVSFVGFFVTPSPTFTVLKPSYSKGCKFSVSDLETLGRPSGLNKLTPFILSDLKVCFINFL